MGYSLPIGRLRLAQQASAKNRGPNEPRDDMKNVTLLALAASAGLSFAPQAMAQTSRHQPHVIAGLGPEEMGVYAPPPQTALRRTMPGQPAAPAQQGRYGGGFIEFLVTGQSQPPRPSSGALSAAPPALYHAPPQQQHRAPAIRHAPALHAPNVYAPAVYAPRPAPAYVEERPQPQPRARMAALAPDPAPRVSRAVDPQFLRQDVAYDGPHAPGTVIVDTPRRMLFLVQPNGRALRYGIGVGRPGFEWSGVKRVTRKAEWPDWRPPPEMLKRRPDLPRFMKGGPDNPLGARALYLGSSLYRIHGTNEPHTIGRNVSSGCIRMMNDDVTDLYQRVPVGAKVVVI